ncbi:ABC transporter ATP-binding protein [Glacieibacterium sp.]|uniref:ABC transporter ATP-binding protein n=1 Tax=Glacieibacterium sp. TaxID=2860237 RepID=UPI003B00DACE
MSSVAVQDLSKSFGAATVLHPTDLSIDEGEFVVIIGPSGCGKSTLLRLLAGLETPTSGRVLIGGRDVTMLEPAARDLAMVFQSYALYPHLTVFENIAFPLRMAKLDKAEIAARVAKVAALLELEPLLDRRPRALSGGQRQRVSIGRAIVREPAVLLLDEPLSNLDAALRVKMRHEFARLHQRLGTTMIYVTHDQIEAMTLANRIVVMSKGRVEQVGAPLDLYRTPATIRVAEAIGSPAMNLMAVRIERAEALEAVVTLPHGSECRVAAKVPVQAVGTQATLGVRPEHLRIDPEGVFGGRVELFERLGPLSFAHLGEAGALGSIVAQLPPDRHVTLGEAVCFSVAATDAQLFAADGSAFPRT